MILPARRLPLLSLLGLALSGTAGAQQSVADWLASYNLNTFKNLQECMDDTRGFLETLFADRLAAKLAISSQLSAEERRFWQANIDGLRAVRAEHRMFSPPDPARPNQYLDGLTEDEFRAIHSMNTRFGQEVQLICEDKYGDMAFTVRDGKSESQKEYEASLRARMIEATDVSTLPLTALPSPFPEAGPSAAEQLAEAQAASRAALAGAEANSAGIVDCTQGMISLRWSLMADKLQQRLDTATELSAQQRDDWAADIAATRRAAEQGLAAPEAVDPANPYRFMTWLTPEDQTEIATQYGAGIAALTARCTQA